MLSECLEFGIVLSSMQGKAYQDSIVVHRFNCIRAFSYAIDVPIRYDLTLTMSIARYFAMFFLLSATLDLDGVVLLLYRIR